MLEHRIASYERVLAGQMVSAPLPTGGQSLRLAREIQEAETEREVVAAQLAAL